MDRLGWTGQLLSRAKSGLELGWDHESFRVIIASITQDEGLKVKSLHMYIESFAHPTYVVNHFVGFRAKKKCVR